MATKPTNQSQIIDLNVSDATLQGGNAMDTLTVRGNGNTLDGGNGRDALSATGNDNNLLGGNGDDSLTASGRGNELDGGRGSDFLDSTSSAGFYDVGLGNTLTGGLGDDVFKVRNTSDLIVTNDGPDNVVSDGDQVVGVMDVITDYSMGDVIDVGALTQLGSVGLDGFGSGHEHLLLGDGEYAFFRGDMTADGQFTVDAEGDSTLLVYDTLDSANQPYMQGAVVLVGVTDPDDVTLV